MRATNTLPETFSGNFSPQITPSRFLYTTEEEEEEDLCPNDFALPSARRSGDRLAISLVILGARLFRAKFALKKRRGRGKKQRTGRKEKKEESKNRNRGESEVKVTATRGEEESEERGSVGSEEIKVLTGLHRDFTAQHPTDAVRGLTSVHGRVDVVSVGLRSEGQKVHGTVDQHLAYVRYGEDRRLVPHKPINPRQRAALGRAMDHGPGLVREFDRGARLRDQHRPLTVQHHSPPCNMDRAAF